MNKKAVAAATAAGTLIGAGIGDKLNPIVYKGTPDTSWHMENLDGTVSHTMQSVEALNQTGNHTAMAIGAGLGALVGGIAMHRALGKQFRGR